MAKDPWLIDQNDLRAYGKFSDQHGRKWGAVIEKKTQAPCSGLSLRTERPVLVRPPIIPPQKYVRVSDITSREVKIRYNQWLEDVDQAWEEWNRFLYEQAFDLYKDAAADEVEKMPPALRYRVGKSRPIAREVVLACRAEDPWVLGFTDERPDWADEFLPATDAVDELAFMKAPPKKKRKPRYQRGQGLKERNALLKQAKDMGLDVDAKSTKAELEEAIAAADTAESAGVGVIDPSWQ